MKKIYGCDPTALGEYQDISKDTCKRYKGYEIYGDQKLEKKNNLCSRQCKHQHNGKDLPDTVQVKCKCKKDKQTGSQNCKYVFKMKGIFKKWKSWGETDSEGNYYVDKNGIPSKQAECVSSAEIGTWSEWGAEGPCEGNCPQDSFHRRRRTCSTDNCGDELMVQNGRKCLKAEFSEKFVEPVTIEAKRSSIEGRQCSVRIAPGWAHFDYDTKRAWFNEGDYCHFPSFGKGWFDKVMNNGDHVQMGVKCDNDWNYEDHSIAKRGENCRLICKNLSDNDNVYTPITDQFVHFQCRSPIPIFAFQKKNCHKNLVTGEFYDECYRDWVKNGLNLGTMSPHENTENDDITAKDPKPVG